MGEKEENSWVRCIGYEPEYDNMAALKAWVEMEERKAEAEAQNGGGRGFMGGLW